MSKRFGILAVLLCGWMLATAGSAMAAAGGSKETGTGTFLDTIIQPDATGTPVNGVVTIYYEPEGVQGTGKNKKFIPVCPVGDTATRMYYFMRFQFNGENHGFSSYTGNLCFSTGLTDQAAAVGGFVSSVVIPTLFPSTPTAPYAIKAVTNIVIPVVARPPTPQCCADPLLGGFNGLMEFMVMDVTLAVQ